MSNINLNIINSAKIPDVLFYKRPKNSIMKPPQEEFVAFSTKGDKNWGELIIHKTNLILRDDYNGDTLAIDFIESKNKHNGLGKAMINFAKNYSKQVGCNGYIILKATSIKNEEDVPHIFYKKENFSTLDKKIDKKLDYFIKKKLFAKPKDFPSMLMFYPPKEKTNKFREFFLKICKKRLH